MMATFKSMLALSAAILLAASGCGEQEPAPPSPGGQDTGILPSDIGSQIGEQANEAAAALAKNYAEQLEQQESQIESLKASARTLADDQLNGLIDAIDNKLNAARGKLEEIKSADQGSTQALGQELGTLMSELKNLYQQAMDRVAELQKG